MDEIVGGRLGSRIANHKKFWKLRSVPRTRHFCEFEKIGVGGWELAKPTLLALESFILQGAMVVTVF
jgi:hypothetical protein